MYQEVDWKIKQTYQSSQNSLKKKENRCLTDSDRQPNKACDPTFTPDERNESFASRYAFSEKVIRDSLPQVQSDSFAAPKP